MALAHLRAARAATGADVALTWGVKDEYNVFEPEWFALADAATASRCEPTLVCTMTGAELRELHEKWISKNELMALPDYQPEDVEAERSYRVVISPHLTWKPMQLRRNLRNVEAGPEYRPETVWQQIFTEKVEKVRKAQKPEGVKEAEGPENVEEQD